MIGTAARSECHGNPDLWHRVSHVIVINSKGEILLQKRSKSKFIQPGKWDTSVGGHLDPGESYIEGAVREMKEELGIKEVPIRFLYKYVMSNEIETEIVSTFLVHWDGPIEFDQNEIDEVRAFSVEEIGRNLGTGFFTPNFEEEYGYFCESIKDL